MLPLLALSASIGISMYSLVWQMNWLYFIRDSYYLSSREFSYLSRLSRASEFWCFEYFSTFDTFWDAEEGEREGKEKKSRNGDLRRNTDHG